MTTLKQAVRELHQLSETIRGFLELDEVSQNDYSAITSELDDMRSDLISDELFQKAAAILYCGDEAGYLDEDYDHKAREVIVDGEVIKSNRTMEEIKGGKVSSPYKMAILPLLEKALDAWLGEATYPNMGKFESEELYRVASAYFGKEVR